MIQTDAETLTADEGQRLRRCLRDVIALSALPAVWAGFDPLRVAESLADVLIRTLDLDFVYVAVPPRSGREPLRVVRVGRTKEGAQSVSAIESAVEGWLAQRVASRPSRLPSVLGGEPTQMTALPLGHGAAVGILVAGAPHLDFPTEQDRLLLGVAANQASVVLQRLAAEHELRRSEQQLETQRAHLQQVFTRAPAFIATLRGPEHVFEMANPAYLQLIGRQNIVGMPVREALPELAGQGYDELLDQVYRSGEPFVTNEKRAELARGAGGALEEAFVSFVYQPLREVDGTISGIFVHGIEVTEQVHARQRIEDLAQVNRTITENATAALFMLDARGHPTFMNPAAEAMTGRQLEEIRHLPLHEAIRHADPDGSPYPRPRWPIDRALPQAKVRAHEDLFVRRDGSFFPVLVAAQPIIRDGTAIGTVLEVRDITEEKRARAELQNSETLLRTIVDTEPECVMLVDQGGGIRQINPAGLRMIEAESLDQVEGSCFHSVIAPEHRIALEDLNERVFSGESATLQFEIVGLKGTRRYMETHAVPLRDQLGQIIAQLAVTRDISDRKRDEEELQRRAAELAERDRSKDEFLAMLAHELRNPLAPVLNAAQVLQALGPQDPALGRQMAVIDRQARHMARLLDDLLDVSRITQGKIELRKQEVDLALVVEQAVESNRSGIEQRLHQLSVAVPAEPLLVIADPTRLQQVIGNLLNNAAKYTEPGGQISLQVTHDSEAAILRITDTGVGIPPSLQQRVFDLFTQGDRSLARSEGGLGIGLTMVKRLVELHEGTVTVYSQGSGQGSEFTVRWPLSRSSGSAPAPVTPVAAAATSRSARQVLIVDDNRDAAETLGELVILWGHQARVVHDGLSALRAVAEEPPEVVILDISMPGMDGYEVARRLRDTPRLPALRLIALTGYGQEQDRQRALDAGFDAHLTKPVNPDLLRTLLTTFE